MNIYILFTVAISTAQSCACHLAGGEQMCAGEYIYIHYIYSHTHFKYRWYKCKQDMTLACKVFHLTGFLIKNSEVYRTWKE